MIAVPFDTSYLILFLPPFFPDSHIRGQHKPFFCPHIDCGDYVVVSALPLSVSYHPIIIIIISPFLSSIHQVVNARHVQFMGRKMKDKKYYWHTLHPGGLKETTPKALMEKDRSEEVGETVIQPNQSPRCLPPASPIPSPHHQNSLTLSRCYATP